MDEESVSLSEVEETSNGRVLHYDFKRSLLNVLKMHLFIFFVIKYSVYPVALCDHANHNVFTAASSPKPIVFLKFQSSVQ